MKRLDTSFRLSFCRTSGTVSPSLCEPYNLNHVSVSVFPITPRLSCLPLASHTLTYPRRHHLIQGCWCWLINIRNSVFFYFILLSHQSFHSCLLKVFHQSYFYSSPPWVLSPTFHFPKGVGLSTRVRTMYVLVDRRHGWMDGCCNSYSYTVL
jgi:hypothetical protein